MRNALIILAFILLFGCIGEWRTVAKPHENFSGTGTEAAAPGAPEKVGYLYVSHEYGSAGEDDWYDVSFTLEDNNGNVVTAPGSLLVKIVDEDGNTLYSSTSAVSESDFESSSGYPFYDNLVYTKPVYFADINESATYYANFTVEFTTGGNTIAKTKNTYLSYDLVGYADNYSYSSGSELNTVNMTQTKGGLEVTLSKAGYGYYSDFETDLEFKNAGSKKKTVTITDSALVIGGVQYSPSAYYYDYELGNIYPGATLEDTLTFYSVEEAPGNATLYLELEVAESGSANQTVDMQFSFAQ